jgi:hypothetical protein
LIIGTVVENTTGAEHGGVVYDRWLIVRLADGGRIDVFDPGPPAELALVAAVPTGVRVDGLGSPTEFGTARSSIPRGGRPRTPWRWCGLDLFGFTRTRGQAVRPST